MLKKMFILVAAGVLCLLGNAWPAAAQQASSPYPELFEEIVQIVQEHFYNPDQIAKDFPALRDTFRPQAERAATPEEFSGLVNAMLDGLHASHTYYLTPDDYEYYQLGALFSKIPDISAMFQGQEVTYPSVGILTETREGRVFIAEVLAGSVAGQAGLLKGDEILSVDGKPYAPIAPLRSRIGKDVSFEIRRHEGDEPMTRVLQPVSINPKQEFLLAQQASVRVFEQAGVRVGYVHIYSYAGTEYHEELVNALIWGELKDSDALVIDLRYGMGGAWLQYLNIFNPDIPEFSMFDRQGAETVVDSQWRKPAVYLVNGYTRSGKELLAFGAKKYRLATVMGERTAGHTLGGRLFPLSNGDALFLAVNSCRIDGEDLEGTGVAPDIEIPFDIRYCAGQDLQLEKALEYLAGQVGKERRGEPDKGGSQ